MRRTRTLAGLGIAVAAVLALTGCNSGTPTDPGSGGGDDGGDAGAIWEVATDVSLEGSPTFDKMVDAGKVTMSTSHGGSPPRSASTRTRSSTSRSHPRTASRRS